MKTAITFQQAALKLGWSEGKLRGLVDRGHFPRPFRCGSRKYYTEGMINDFFAKKEEEALNETNGKIHSRHGIQESIPRRRYGDFSPKKISVNEGASSNKSKRNEQEKSHPENAGRVISLVTKKEDGSNH